MSLTKLKCQDCGVKSVEVHLSERYNVQVCASCFMVRAREELIKVKEKYT